MADALRLYVKYVAAGMRSQMQYRMAFVMQSFGMFVITGGGSLQRRRAF